MTRADLRGLALVGLSAAVLVAVLARPAAAPSAAPLPRLRPQPRPPLQVPGPQPSLLRPALPDFGPFIWRAPIQE